MTTSPTPSGDHPTGNKPAGKTITKRDLIEQISELTGQPRSHVKSTLQHFLDIITHELAEGNRIEFRDFGVFEVRERAARMAQNPRTLERVPVPAKRSVKFKVGRMMQQRVEDGARERGEAQDPPEVNVKASLGGTKATDTASS